MPQCHLVSGVELLGKFVEVEPHMNIEIMSNENCDYYQLQIHSSCLEVVFS